MRSFKVKKKGHNDVKPGQVQLNQKRLSNVKLSMTIINWVKLCQMRSSQVKWSLRALK